MFLGTTLYSQSACLHPGVYRVLTNLIQGDKPTSIPSRESRNTPSCFMLQKLKISTGLMGNLARMQTTFYSLHQLSLTLQGTCCTTKVRNREINDGLPQVLSSEIS